jgi:hypothetical protein
MSLFYLEKPGTLGGPNMNRKKRIDASSCELANFSKRWAKNPPTNIRHIGTLASSSLKTWRYDQ